MEMRQLLVKLMFFFKFGGKVKMQLTLNIQNSILKPDKELIVEIARKSLLVQ